MKTTPAQIANPVPWQCCPPLLTGNLTPEQAEALAGIFRVLGDPTRLYLLSLIAAQPQQKVPACALVETLGLSQPTVSHHLKVMYATGLLTRERRGTGIYYQLVPECLMTLRNVLVGTTS
jgi:ArsR family transcriptional regulator